MSSHETTSGINPSDSEARPDIRKRHALRTHAICFASLCQHQPEEAFTVEGQAHSAANSAAAVFAEREEIPLSQFPKWMRNLRFGKAEFTMGVKIQRISGRNQSPSGLFAGNEFTEGAFPT